MADTTVDALMRAESRLTRSFIACVVIVVALFVWAAFLATPSPTGTFELGTVGLALVAAQLACYIWYAIAAGAAAKLLGDSGWKYIAWILAAPLLARLPIPIVSTLIGASPLAIKFLLGSQLQSAIRQESYAGVHEGR